MSLLKDWFEPDEFNVVYFVSHSMRVRTLIVWR